MDLIYIYICGFMFCVVTFFRFVAYLSDLDDKINKIDRDLAIIKTALVMRNIVPEELAHKIEEVR